MILMYPTWSSTKLMHPKTTFQIKTILILVALKTMSKQMLLWLLNYLLHIERSTSLNSCPLMALTWRLAIHYPSTNILSYYSVKKLVLEITGIIAVYSDMCINACHAFTGPFSQCNSCTICGESRYNMVQLASTDKKVPCQQFCTILLGPQLQALHRSHTGATNMHVKAA